MLITFFRSILIYIFVLIVMRLMGKREIGQLQPFELAIAIMIADLASIPMTDPRNSNIKWDNINSWFIGDAFNYFNNKYEKYKSKRNYLCKANYFSI